MYPPCNVPSGPARRRVHARPLPVRAVALRGSVPLLTPSSSSAGRRRRWRRGEEERQPRVLLRPRRSVGAPAAAADRHAFFFGDGAEYEPDYEQLQDPASMAAVESMPAIGIGDGHVSSDAHCAVCKEAMAVGAEAREVPCKHRYHSECILPWLSVKNTCLVCCHELPADVSWRGGAEE